MTDENPKTETEQKNKRESDAALVSHMPAKPVDEEAPKKREEEEAQPYDDDEIVMVLNKSIWYKPASLILSCLLTIGPLVGSFFVEKDWARYALLVLALLGLVWLLVYLFITKIFSTYTITRRRVTAELGFISREIREVEIRHIRNINVRQTLVQRLFGIGDVQISTAGQAGIEVEFQSVHDPLQVRRRIMDRK